MLFDFKCPLGHVFERNVQSSVKELACPECEAPANRIISAPSLKIPFNGDYPGAAYKWARYHEKQSKKYD
jgi:hypothetical protein